MKAIRKMTAGPGLELVEVPIPKIKPNQVLIEVETAAICGTDLHIYKWDEWSAGRVHPPVTVGHEFAGRIVEVGSQVKGLKEGTLVTAEGHFVCGTCYYCRTGQGHICDNVRVLGVDVDGIFAEYAAVDASNVWVLPEGSDPVLGAIRDPLGNAFHTVYPVELREKNVLITGCGPIGLFAVAIAKHAGARRVFVTDMNEYRLALAKQVGADFAINVKNEDAVKIVKDETGIGADVLLEMSGSAAALASGIAAVRKGAEVSLLGLYPGQVTVNLNEVIWKALTLYGINGRRMYDNWYQMDAALDAGLNVYPIITHRFTFEQFKEAMELMSAGMCGKVLLYPSGEKMERRWGK